MAVPMTSTQQSEHINPARPQQEGGGLDTQIPFVRSSQEDRLSYEIIQAEIRSRLQQPQPKPGKGSRYPWMSEADGKSTYREVKEFSDLVLAYNQGFYTAQSDKRGFEAWAEYCAKRACGVFLQEGNEMAFQENAVQFCAYDAAIYGNKANTISARVSSIVAAHSRAMACPDLRRERA